MLIPYLSAGMEMLLAHGYRDFSYWASVKIVLTNQSNGGQIALLG